MSLYYKTPHSVKTWGHYPDLITSVSLRAGDSLKGAPLPKLYPAQYLSFASAFELSMVSERTGPADTVTV